MTRTRTLLRGVLAATLVGGLTLAAAPQETRSPYVEDPDPLVRQKHRRVAGPEARPAHALGHVLAVGHRGIVVAVLGRRAVVPPIDGRLRDLQGRVREAADDVQSGAFRSGAVGEGGARCGDAIRRVHDQTPRRLQHVRHAGNGLPHHLAEHAVLRNPRADVTKGIFDAFRAEGFKVGAYFSKPDWHSPDYWWPYFATPDRNPNYDIRKYPERWARFVKFTHAQIDELMSRYGRVDILWLDGGWVRPRTDAEITAEINKPDYKFARIQSQDIDMPRLAAAARAKQPGLIVVDRDVPGPYQNYLTPEARVPPQPLPYPWEVPMPMARSWSFVPNDVYKTPRVLIQMLVDVVAKGGNLLLNIGPGPDGTWHDAAYDRLAALGAWMKVNSEAIYATRPVAPYADGQVRFTRAKNGTVYAIYLPRADEDVTTLPRELTIPTPAPAAGMVVTLLGTGRTIPWDRSTAGIVAHIPAGLAPPNADAWVFRLSTGR